MNLTENEKRLLMRLLNRERNRILGECSNGRQLNSQNIQVKLTQIDRVKEKMAKEE